MFLLPRIEEDINYHVCELNCDLKLSAVITFHACEYLKLSMRVSIRWFILWVLKFVPLWRFLQKDEHVKSETSIIHWQLARRRAIWKSARIYRKQLFCKGCRFLLLWKKSLNTAPPPPLHFEHLVAMFWKTYSPHHLRLPCHLRHPHDPIASITPCHPRHPCHLCQPRRLRHLVTLSPMSPISPLSPRQPHQNPYWSKKSIVWSAMNTVTRYSCLPISSSLFFRPFIIT